MNKIIRWFYGVLPKSTLINHLGKEFVHLTLDYKTAQEKIKEAEKAFVSVKELTSKDFESKKRATLARTEKYIEGLENTIEDEEIEIEAKYMTAKGKNLEKKNSVGKLSQMLEEIGAKDFPLK